MKNSWARPSISRDFVLLSAAVFFLLILVSARVTYITYSRQADRITSDLEKEASRVERTISIQMEDANYLLTALGKQIILDPERNLTKLAQTFKSLDNKHYIYSIFSWIDPEQRLVASSNKGVLDKPVDISDRDYVKKALAEPWKMAIGRPIEGRVSGHWVIPVAMGITDYTGKFIGTLLISIDINVLTERISTLVKRDGISYAIISKTLIPLTQVSDNKNFVNDNFPAQTLVNVNFSTNQSGLVKNGSSFFDTGNYAYYRVSKDYPYIVLLGYDTHLSSENMETTLWWRLMQVLAMAVFFVLFLWIIRARMTKPLIDLADVAAKIMRGENFDFRPKTAPQEIRGLAEQLSRISDYMAEMRRIEDEQRHKMFIMKKSRERAELDMRSKSEFLTRVCHDMRLPLTDIVGFAQILKDQLYGHIENRKYKQYAMDIHSAGSKLLERTQELAAIAKTELGYVELDETMVNVERCIESAVRVLNDKMHAQKLSVHVEKSDSSLRLIADELRLQQIISNMLLYAFARMRTGATITLSTNVLQGAREKSNFVLLMRTNPVAPTREELAELVGRMTGGAISYELSPTTEDADDTEKLPLEMARTLASLHHAAIGVEYPGYKEVSITLVFGGNRIRFIEEADI